MAIHRPPVRHQVWQSVRPRSERYVHRAGGRAIAGAERWGLHFRSRQSDSQDLMPLLPPQNPFVAELGECTGSS